MDISCTICMARTSFGKYLEVQVQNKSPYFPSLAVRGGDGLGLWGGGGRPEKFLKPVNCILKPIINYTKIYTVSLGKVGWLMQGRDTSSRDASSKGRNIRNF